MAHPKLCGTLEGLIRATAEYAAGFPQGRHSLMPLFGPPPPTPLAAAPPPLRKTPAAPAPAFSRPLPAAAPVPAPSAFPGIALAERQLQAAALRMKAFGIRLLEFLVW